MLLVLVFGVVLVLVGVTASALAALVSAHLSSARLNSVVANDAALVGFFVNDKLLASDVDEDGPTVARAATLSGELGHFIGDGGIVRIEIRSPDGRVIASDDLAAVGLDAESSAGVTLALDGEPFAALIEAGGNFEAVGGPLGAESVVQEYLPIVEEGGDADRDRRPVARCHAHPGQPGRHTARHHARDARRRRAAGRHAPAPLPIDAGAARPVSTPSSSRRRVAMR